MNRVLSTMIPTMLVVAQAAASSPTPKPNPFDDLVAAQAIASYEYAPWKKLHPKADVQINYANAEVTAPMALAVRKKLGFKDSIATLDPNILTIVLQPSARTTPKELAAEAYVFLGSFPKGYRALYVIQRSAKPNVPPRVVSRTIIQRYEMRKLAPISKT